MEVNITIPKKLGDNFRSRVSRSGGSRSSIARSLLLRSIKTIKDQSVHGSAGIKAIDSKVLLYRSHSKENSRRISITLSSTDARGLGEVIDYYKKNSVGFASETEACTCLVLLAIDPPQPWT